MVKVAIIVLNWRQPQLTCQTVNSLLALNHKKFSYRIFLVDNASHDDSLVTFRRVYKNTHQVKILTTKSNLGYVGGNNFAMRLALKQKYDYFLIANNDIIVDPSFLENLVTCLISHPNIGVVGPKIYFASGYEYHHDRYSKNELGHVLWSAGGKMDWDNILGSNIGVDEVDHGQRDIPTTDIDFISGCCFLTSHQVLKKVGLFDEKYFMYLEDVDFCQKVKHCNYQLMYLPQSKIWHVNSGSSGGGAIHDYFITRNRLIFGLRYAKLRTKLALIREAVNTYFTSPNSWKKTAVKDYFYNRLGQGSWGRTL